MAPKRKMEISVEEESDRVLFSAFQDVANKLSQLYTQTVNQQKVAYRAGKEHALKSFYEWMIREMEDERMVTAKEMAAYLKHKLNIATAGPLGAAVLGQSDASQSPVMKQDLAGASSSCAALAPVNDLQGNGQGQDGCVEDMQLDITSDSDAGRTE